MTASNTGDWRHDCNDVAEIHNKARNERRFTDVQFVMGEGPTKTVFYAHKLILACGSPVFEAMFYGPLPETRRVIETDDDPEAFEMLLNYIYGSRPELSSLSSAWKYFTVGEKYLVTKVQDIAKEYIESVPLTDEAFFHLIQNNLYSSALFTERITSYIKANTSRIIESEEFLRVPEYIIDSVLQMDELNASEYHLLSAVTKWGYKNIDHPNSKDFIKFYRYIRFSTITMEEFFQFIASFPDAIDAQSSLKILQYLQKTFASNLPEWCSRNTVSRFQVSQPMFEDNSGFY